MNNKGKTVIALAAIATAGVALGMLLAPDKGCNTRKKLNDQGRKIAGSMKNKFYKGKKKFNDLKEDIEKAAEEKVSEFV